MSAIGGLVETPEVLPLCSLDGPLNRVPILLARSAALAAGRVATSARSLSPLHHSPWLGA